MNDDLKKAKALQKEYIKARASKQTSDDMLTWLLKRKAADKQLKGFGMANFGDSERQHATRAQVFGKKMRQRAQDVRNALKRNDCDAAFENLMLMEKYHSRFTVDRFASGKGKLPAAKATNSVAAKFKKACVRK